jgi:hypothetical protein
MRDTDRFKLLGSYRTPRVRMGTVLSCELRDADVIVVGYSDGKIPWPVGTPRHRGGRPGLVLYGALAAAVRRESNQAVAHWFGVASSVVTRWRQALRVAELNPGSRRLWASVARDPDRRGKIAAARVGKPRAPHVIEAMRKGRTGKPHPPEVRARLSAFLRERAKVFVPCGRRWEPWEDELVGTRPAPEVARRTGRTLDSVYSRRGKLGVPDGRRR